MPPYLYPLPQTGTVILGGSLLIDPTNTYASQLAQASQARTRLQLALKSAEDAKTSDSAAVGVVDGYLPYIRGIQSCLDSDLLLWKTDPSFPWRSSLTAYSLTPPTLYYPSLQVEELFVLVAYALALNNYARLILDSLPVGSLGTGGGGSVSAMAQRLTADEEKRTAAGLARAVDLLCQAAGVMQWAADNICPSVESARAASGRLGKGKVKWPAETGAEACRGLSMTYLADAHIVAIRKLCLPVVAHSLFAPAGPPLPAAHPSPSLLAKLYTHVGTLYASASAHLLAHSSLSGRDTRTKAEKERDTSDVEGDIIPPLCRYLRKEGVLSTAMSLKWYGVDAGENGKGQRVGEALAWVKEARSRLEELEDGKLKDKMKGLSFGKNKEKVREERRNRRGRVEREAEDAEAWVRAYQKMNDTVAFQPVPLASTLTRPEGRPILNAKPFKPPPPKMGAPEAGQESTYQPEEYAGKGNYF